MDYIVHVSFPRSGHHALVRCMMDLLPEELHYCDYYRHCRQVPCIDSKTNYQKTHDFDVALAVQNELKYIVQVRHPLEAIPSWYEYKFNDPYTRSGESRWKKLLDRWVLRDNRLHWNYFFPQKLRYWERFADKWAGQIARPNVLLLTYDDFVSDTAKTLRRALEFSGAETRVGDSELQAVVREHKVERRRDLTDFRYFDRGKFRRAQERLGTQMAAFDLKEIEL